MHYNLSSKTFNRKIAYCIVCITIYFIIIIIRLIYLQIIFGTNYHELSKRNYTRIELIGSPRGNILDCQGRLLATNRPVTCLYWQGTGNRTLSLQQQQLFNLLNDILPLEVTSEGMLNKINHAEKTKKRILIATDINFEQLSKILELFAHQPNITIFTHFKRFYPHGTIASHILGYIHQMNLETIGKMGLEKMLEQHLKGHQGKLLKIINSVGSNINQYELYKALAGENCTTTLDLDIQNIAESIFPAHESGTIIIMNPKTGALRAVVSKPHFAPETFLDPIAQGDWDLLQEGKPFINRAFNACYPPASPFKLITMSAALEQHLITPETITYCRGFLRFKGRSYHCSKKQGHGSLSALEALAHSCNIIFFEIAKRISIDTLADYAQRFGLGQKTNILFPELQGLIPTTAWKLQAKGERWWPGETLSAAIGQSYLLTTPIQVACMLASIFEGYLVNPRILETEPIIKKPLRILPSTREFLKEGMKQATVFGTAVKVGSIKDITISAKTGTGQTSALNKREMGKEFLEHASFVAHFNYKDQDPLVIVIVIEHAGSSRAATATAREFLIAYRNWNEQQEFSNKS